MTNPIILLISIACLFFVLIEYLKGRNLFFRNDEWHYMTKALGYIKSKNIKERLSFLFNDLWGEDKKLLPHVHPLSLLLFFEKFRIFRTRFHLHFYVSLFFHIINIFLIYWVCLKMTTNEIASLTGAVLFGACALIADTVFLPGFLVYILITTLLLISIGLHPVFNPNDGDLAYILFFVANALSPWLMELGLVSVFVSLCLFIIYGQLEIYPISLLCIFTALPLFARLYISRKIKNRGFYFIGFLQILKNIIVGNLKLFIGIFGRIFNMKVSDTLYILKPNFKSFFTFISLSLTIIIFYSLLLFISDKQIVILKKMELILFFISASSPFLMVSLAYNMPNPNKDLSHQMPRYFYYPAALICIILAILIARYFALEQIVLLMLFVSVSGTYSIKVQLSLIMPMTDWIKERLLSFKNTALLLENPRCSSLDWSFSVEGVRAYLEIEDEKEAEYVRDNVDKLNVIGERLYKKGESDKARALFVNIAKYTEYAPAFNNLGVIEHASGNLNNALLYFTRAFSIDTKNRDILTNLLQCTVESNNMQIAQIALTNYLAEKPENIEMLEIPRRINSITV